MRLTVLGCDGSYPGPGGATSGYLVRAAGLVIWLDAGSGTLANLQRHVALHDVDAVILSHDHPDHWSDLQGFHVACRYVHGIRGVPVYGPAPVAAASPDQGGSTLDWHVVADGSCVAIGDVRLRFSRTDHPTETLAVRFDADGRSLGYSADTGDGWSLGELGPGLDLALVEATLPLDQPSVHGHLNGAEAGAMAREAGAARLLVTHLWPTLDGAQVRAAASAAYGAPAEVAELHGEYEI